jgi:hypothetical protein
MPIYTFNSLKPDSSVSSSCELRTSTEDEAREVAADLLRDEEFQLIEVWKERRLICRVAKDETDS